MYKKVAGTKEGANDHEEAVRYYQKCLEAARLAQEKRSEGMACYRLGRAYIMMEEPLRAISFLEDYEAICKEVMRASCKLSHPQPPACHPCRHDPPPTTHLPS